MFANFALGSIKDALTSDQDNEEDLPVVKKHTPLAEAPLLEIAVMENGLKIHFGTSQMSSI